MADRDLAEICNFLAGGCIGALVVWIHFLAKAADKRASVERDGKEQP